MLHLHEDLGIGQPEDKGRGGGGRRPDASECQTRCTLSQSSSGRVPRGFLKGLALAVLALFNLSPFGSFPPQSPRLALALRLNFLICKMEVAVVPVRMK